MNQLKLIKIAVNLGDAESLIQHPATNDTCCRSRRRTKKNENRGHITPPVGGAGSLGRYPSRHRAST